MKATMTSESSKHAKMRSVRPPQASASFTESSKTLNADCLSCAAGTRSQLLTFNARGRICAHLGALRFRGRTNRPAIGPRAARTGDVY